MTVTTVHSANFIGLFVLVLPFQRKLSSSLFSSVLIWGFFVDLKKEKYFTWSINCEYGGDFSLLVWVVLSWLSFLVIWRVVLIDQLDSWDPHCYKARWPNMQRQRSCSSWHAAMSEPTCGKNVRISQLACMCFFSGLFWDLLSLVTEVSTNKAMNGSYIIFTHLIIKETRKQIM